ncbi:MAG: sensor histidine kinase [Gemmatimonadota bacterium]|nr:sensor histidine kinase [Gemmatimonadota bacterium]
MRLADFIEKHSERILVEWEAFAATSGPAGMAMDPKALRDHALGMLKIIIVDLRTPQTDSEGVEKSKGNADATPATPDTPAEVHGSGRAQSGFSVGEMVSEYRALRASVIRLWIAECGSLAEEDLKDLMRFNEAIDQAMAESITRYTEDLDYSKEMFLAILGHDLRSPLGTVIMASQFMLEEGNLAEPQRTLTTRISRSARRMSQMVSDLLDFTRGSLGSGIPITVAEMDLGLAVRHVVDEVRGAQPDSRFQYNMSGNLRGSWDSARISQVVANLLGNAAEHGTPSAMIDVTAEGEARDVIIRVHNFGTAIAPEGLPAIFSPYKRLKSGSQPALVTGSLGLGLYIAERIVTAHGGTIDVRSSPEAGTLFTVRLPR